jgi:methylene-fatty-acyl-phospholipid synthase
VEVLPGAVVLLSLERFFYLWLCRDPGRFAAWCRVPWSKQPFDPVLGVEALFYVFKALLLIVIIWWCFAFGGRIWPPAAGPVAITIGAMLVLCGQVLNAAAFHRLGRISVFYGGQFGHPVRWQTDFPFSWFRHPQYVAGIASIWGVMLILRYPAPDWIGLPMIETIYYWLGARLESYRHAAPVREAAVASEN